MTPQDLVQLSLLLDGELSPAEAAGLRGRLNDEPELRRAYERLQRLGSVVLLPTALDAKASAEALESIGLAPPRAPRWPLGAGAVLLVIVAGLVALQPSEAVEPAPEAASAPPPPPVAAPLAPATPPVEVPTITLPADAGVVVVSVPREGEWIKVRGVGPIEFGGTRLAVRGEALLSVDRGGVGRLDAPPGTRSTEFFATPDGATIVVFVLSGAVAAPPPAVRDAGRPAYDRRLVVGQRTSLRVPRGSAFRVLDASILRARVVGEDRVEVQGLAEGVTSLEFDQGPRSITFVVFTRDDNGQLGRVIDVGDVQTATFPHLKRWSAGDRTIVRIEDVGTRLTFTGLRPGRTTLQLWFDDGRYEHWALMVPDARPATVGVNAFLFLSLDQRGLLHVPPGATVAVEPASLAQPVPLEAASAALVPLAQGKGKIVVSETSGARHTLQLDVR